MPKLYEMLIPEYANNGHAYTREHEAWEAKLLDIAGGYTRCSQSYGSWRDPEDGKVYRDETRPYRVSCNPAQRRLICYEAARLFSDQKAFYWSEIGEAWVISRAEIMGGKS
jgi:hypothetical protein